MIVVANKLPATQGMETGTLPVTVRRLRVSLNYLRFCYLQTGGIYFQIWCSDSYLNVLQMSVKILKQAEGIFKSDI